MTATTTTPTTPATPAPSAMDKRRLLIIIGALLLGMLLAVLDSTITSTALPTIVGDLGGASHLTWVVTAYLLTATVSTPLWGKLGDLYGRKSFFQISIVIFLIGSIMAGFSHSLSELIFFRAIQGIGGGGLMIGAQAIIGDIVSPRERGRYMGLFGAVFGLATVVGPLIGGVIVENLSWRWVFYINIPLGILAMVVTTIVLPKIPPGVTSGKKVIDYLGALLLAVSASALIIYTSLGGISEPWFSPWMVVTLVVGLVMVVGFVLAERRAVEPVMPMRLFSNRVFSASVAISFIVGFAMFGVMTYLPLYFQVVKGATPTESGLRLFPTMIGLFAAAIISGRLVSSRGKYKIFPVLGTGIMAIGIFLLSFLNAHTGFLETTIFQVILGVGIGCILQVVIVAVQNAVDFRDLGVSVSAATFFREIGGSFGTATFGAVYANNLVREINSHLGHGLHVSSSIVAHSADPTLVAHLPAAIHLGVVTGFADTLQKVFLYAAPVAVLAFAVSWLLPEIELRDSVRLSIDGKETLSAPTDRNSLQQMERLLDRMAIREDRNELYGSLVERAGLDLQPQACWMLFRLVDHPDEPLSALAARLHTPRRELEPLVDQLVASGQISVNSPIYIDQPLTLSAKGRESVAALGEARRVGLQEFLGGWDVDGDADVTEMVRQLAQSLLADDDKLLEAFREPVSSDAE